MTDDVKNPFLEPENYYAGYEKSINELKERPEATELDKLMYLTFMTEFGKALLKEIDKRFLMPNLVRIGSANYAEALTFSEGFKEAFRFIKSSIDAHQQRINKEEK